MTDRFQHYYSIQDIAARLDLSPARIRREMWAGEFGTPVGQAGSEMVAVGDDYRIPWSGVEHFLRQHSGYRPELEALRQERRDRIAAARLAAEYKRDIHDPQVTVVARSPGEAVRKIAKTAALTVLTVAVTCLPQTLSSIPAAAFLAALGLFVLCKT